MTKYKRDYLFLRPDSQNWHVRLQSPGRRVEKSLGTPDRAQAEILAMPYIQQHKTKLLEARPGYQPGFTWQQRTAPGQEPFTVSTSSTDASRRPRIATISADDAMLDTYLKHKNLAPQFAREARTVWELYKQLTDSKPLKDATRDDGRKLADRYEKDGLKSASIAKKVGWLVAAVNLAIDEGKLKFNPFSKVVRQKDDKTRRLPLSENDIRDLKKGFPTISKDDQLVLRILGATGMRLSEAFEIDGEMKERGVRYVIIGKKTSQSMRRVPLPADLLPFLPKTIDGRLFKPQGEASKRLMKFLRSVGITDPGKVVHSLRHRAQDRLRAAGCPEDVRWAILGHEETTVAAGYGAGFPVPMLRKWIDKIGF